MDVQTDLQIPKRVRAFLRRLANGDGGLSYGQFTEDDAAIILRCERLAFIERRYRRTPEGFRFLAGVDLTSKGRALFQFV